MTDLKTSLLVNRQVPEFIREEYPLFITFLEAYYEYLETKQGTQINDLLNKSKDLRYVSDVDYSIDDFENNFFNTYANLIPKNMEVDKEFLIKNVLPLYLAKGSENSFKLLFRMLFNTEVNLTYPKDNILRASDGKWVVDNILRISQNIRSIFVGNGTETHFVLAQQVYPDQVEVYVDDVLQTFKTNFFIERENRDFYLNVAPALGSIVKVVYKEFDPILLSNLGNSLKLTGLTSGATAIIERASKRIISDNLNLGFPFELFIDSRTLQGEFVDGEEIEVLAFDDEGTLLVLHADTFSIVKKINIVSSGASYNVGDVVTFVAGDPIDTARAVVDSVVEGYIRSIIVNYGGAGFQTGGGVNVASATPINLTLAIDGIDTSGVANSTINTYTVYTDVISNLSSTLISAANYGFPATVISNENVNTVIADALSTSELTGLGPITNVVTIFSNTLTTFAPTLTANSLTYTANGSSIDISRFGSIGRVEIVDGGLGYAVGDEIVVGANPYRTYGDGAAAAVKSVDDVGKITQIELQPSRVNGTVNVSNNGCQIVGTGTFFGTEIRIGDRVIVNNQSRYINAISNTTYANVSSNFTATSTNKKLGRYGIYPIGGVNYIQGNFPPLTISTNTGANAVIEFRAIVSDGDDIVPFVGNTAPGAIISIRLLDGGSSYKYTPQIDLTAHGDGSALANTELEDAYIALPGRWTTSDSIISSSERKLEGRNYYVDYSYVTSSTIEFKKYKSVLKQLLHPSGLVSYAELQELALIGPTVATINTSIANTISGTVSVTNTSIYITGTNTKFNTANTRGTLTIGSNVSVNGVIRTVNNIISNTNISVSSAWTITESAQTLTILI